MDKDKSPMTKLSQFLNGNDESKPPKDFKNMKLLGLLLLLGVSIIVLFTGGNKQTEQNSLTAAVNQPTTSLEASVLPKDSKTLKTVKEFQQDYENQLKELLESSVGVKDVSVMVTLDATTTKVFEKNENSQMQQTTEHDKQGGTREIDQQTKNEQTVIVRSGNDEQPVLQKEVMPVVRGVFIVAKGAEQIEVKKNIVEAVTRALDVPSHKVSVLPKK